MPRILIIDDDPGFRTMLSDHFLSRKWDVSSVGNGADGIRLADELLPDIIILDMRMPDMDGIEVLRRLRQRRSGASVIVLTAWGTISDAVEAVKLGAEQYLTKPVGLPELDSLTDSIIHARTLKTDGLYYRQRKDLKIVGSSAETTRLHHVIDLMAENQDTTVLLLGESGTGKGLVAQEIHRRSIRGERPFIDINCAALPESLLESELFGHERGAFTGAYDRKAGLLEAAEGGTVFLDEVGEMPLSVQPKLLRVLENREFKRVGGTDDIHVNVRIIAASNQDLSARVKAGTFREDLYYRLNVFPVIIHPLRERPKDIPDLLSHFVQEYNRVLKKSVEGFSDKAMEVLTRYPWPGNVRELKNTVERVMVLSNGGIIDVAHLPPEITGRARGRHPGPLKPEPTRMTLDQVEQEHILRVLEAAGNNRSKAARILGISRSTLIEKLKKIR